jgi:hypothetical protein
MLLELVVTPLVLAAPVAAAERRIVTDPTGTLRLPRFDGTIWKIEIEGIAVALIEATLTPSKFDDDAADCRLVRNVGRDRGYAQPARTASSASASPKPRPRLPPVTRTFVSLRLIGAAPLSRCS